ncbi:maleylpyruvate isomerase N-terminal domain-containing protein [Glycomyces xiaoerkulensis]|uniref:maleylpyruvate isomerase N-terminal domain-containing protein n=1 Tax=Glycomyces xiaoerkulensis TaxID=2038139 RepID=UPI000C2617B5|nr:maleylpyruvate isomerase N-terminal domain-containing protein [Glycomyces xiaoerkulensis]
MTGVRTRFLHTAEVAAGLLAEPDLADAWDEQSALEAFTVGGLAAHLASQITTAAEALEADHTGKEVIGLYDHYDRAAWLAADIAGEANTRIRDRSEQAAEAGPAAVAAEADRTLADLRRRLPDLGAEAIGGNPAWPYTTSYDHFLTTRIMELVVHADDLAVSLGIATPEFDEDAFAAAAAVLTRLSARRHGQSALVRALARAERAPVDITAL